LVNRILSEDINYGLNLPIDVDSQNVHIHKPYISEF